MSALSSLGFRRVIRVARREHECYEGGPRIRPGDRYAEVIAAPRYDFNPNPGHWTRGRFCGIHTDVSR